MAKLIIIPTPIGNLEDITLRSIRMLKEVDLVLAEDTRQTGKLLKHLELSVKMQAYHLNNEHQITAQIVTRIQGGENVGLVSDAGTPGISDPGFLLVRECVNQGVEVECLPGPTALIPAIVASGFPCDKFYFEGFLPHKKGKQTRLQILSQMPTTVIFYESPHRLVKTLIMMLDIFGSDREIVVVRELTKMFEEHKRGPLSDVLNYFESKTVKGEIVVVVKEKV
ncbi:MAG: 16S rRNA (cytidine1402-2'-O)-methyltransferase [Saprospiraceae bacterium]|jgi:16S rRNA (cytidine1402-2'-O)-methyltransferase